MNKKELANKYIESSKMWKKINEFFENIIDGVFKNIAESEDEANKIQDSIQRAKHRFSTELPKFLEENYVVHLEKEFTEEELKDLISFLESDLNKKSESFNIKINDLIKEPFEKWLQDIFKEYFGEIF